MNKLVRIYHIVIACLGFVTLLFSAASAQIGINATPGVKPRLDAEIYTRNSVVMLPKYSFTTVDPALTVVNMGSCFGAPAPPSLTAQAGIMKDPEGDGPYLGTNVYYYCQQLIEPCCGDVGNFDISGIEITFEQLDTEANVDVIEFSGDGGTASFSGSALGALPKTFIYPASSVMVRFRSNGNAITGQGFRFRWRTVFQEYPSGFQEDVAPTGHVVAFNTLRRSFRAGFIGPDDALSSAFNTTGLGVLNTIRGNYGVGIGTENKVAGAFAVALGTQNTASGMLAQAFGADNTASGYYSTAMGRKVSTDTRRGAFIIGDSDPSNTGVRSASVTDQFSAWFANGYYLRTSRSVLAGVQIGAGQNAWATISDSTKKERRIPIDGPDLLRKIASMKSETWNYKGQRSIRHYGPMAQDFNVAFGRDLLGAIGSDTLIYSHDFAGVTFAGVQQLARDNETLRTTIAQLRARQKQTEDRLTLLEKALLNRRQRVAKR